MQERKAMSVALTMVISIVVLIVISLAVIAITTGSLTDTSKSVQGTTTKTFIQIDDAVKQQTTSDARAGASTITGDDGALDEQ